MCSSKRMFVVVSSCFDFYGAYLYPRVSETEEGMRVMVCPSEWNQDNSYNVITQIQFLFKTNELLLTTKFKYLISNFCRSLFGLDVVTIFSLHDTSLRPLFNWSTKLVVYYQNTVDVFQYSTIGSVVVNSRRDSNVCVDDVFLRN